MSEGAYVVTSVYHECSDTQDELHDFDWYFVCLKDVCILKSNAYHYFAEYRGGLDGYVGKSIPVASIRSCVGVLLVRIIV